jgi:hypothetical protein
MSRHSSHVIGAAVLVTITVSLAYVFIERRTSPLTNGPAPANRTAAPRPAGPGNGLPARVKAVLNSIRHPAKNEESPAAAP